MTDKKTQKQKEAYEFHVKEVEKKFKIEEAKTFKVLASSSIFQSEYYEEKHEHSKSLEKSCDAIQFILNAKELDEDYLEFNLDVIDRLDKILYNLHQIVNKTYSNVVLIYEIKVI